MGTKINKPSKDNSQGQLTTKIAHEISPYWEERGYHVFHDHDLSGKNVGEIVSWFGEYGRNTQLSQIDIAIVNKDSKRVFALIEIEEKDDNPKKILGDIFGIVMGDYINFGRERQFSVGEKTNLIIFVKSNVPHDKRNNFILEKLMNIKSKLATANSAIEKITIKSFRDEDENENKNEKAKKLAIKLQAELERAFKGEQ